MDKMESALREVGDILFLIQDYEFALNNYKKAEQRFKVE